MNEWSDPATFGAVALGVAVLLGLGLLGSLLMLRRNTGRQLRDAQRQHQELSDRLAEIERRRLEPDDATGSGTGPGSGSQGPVAEFLITDIGKTGSAEPSTEPSTGPSTGPPPAVPARIEGRLFADIVLRETVVKAAGLAHGVRRALRPEFRSRLRFEVRREARRSTKQRKVDTKEALREYYARQRAETQTGDVA